MNRSRSAFLSANGWIGWTLRLAKASVVSPITTSPSGPASANERVKKALVAVVQRVERAPYHNLHTLCTLKFLWYYGYGWEDCRDTALVCPQCNPLSGRLPVGSDVGIWFGAVIRADKDRITIGDRSNIQDNCVVHTSAGFPTTLGCDVSVGHGAILHGCTIRDRVLVGMGAIVLNGAVVGEDSIIGAGAVVTEGMQVPPGSVVLGIPGQGDQTDNAGTKGAYRAERSVLREARQGICT
jgi:Carbonic anhydrases/acetyltransferases, isoleucine patch superfamily